jgi:HEPN domain-containing protein
MRVETTPWWRQAQADLQTADIAIAGGQFYAASWFGQQAAEKALKAVLIERTGELPPRTHDLHFLGGKLNVPATIARDLQTLNPVSGLARYPDSLGVAPVDAVRRTDAVRHRDAARRVLVWVENQL